MLSLGLIKPRRLKTLISQTLSRRYWDAAASEAPPRLLLVQPRVRSEALLKSKLSEALALADSLEEQRDGNFSADKASPPYVFVQNPVLRSARARADTYFGPGTVDTIKCHIYGSESKDEVDAVFVNTILSGIQQRNLEREWEKPVLDRVGLIIEIFNAHAHTREAKLQAELAALTYKKSRLVRVRGSDGRFTFGAAGEAEVVSARGRGSGGRGFISGAGETELQLQRRRILERRNTLLAQIEEVRRTRAVQRAARRRQGGLGDPGLPTVAIVGYTNAGKSTMVNALTDGDLYSDSRLFATLDPRLKSVLLPSGKKVLLSDTVGFISDLPMQLVEAFHATLEEVVEADLLVHVVDCTAPNLDEHRISVLQVLQQIGVSNEKLQNMIEVCNKIDCEHVSPEEQACDGEDDDSSSLSENEGGDELDLETQGGADDMKASGESEWEEMIDDEADYADSQSLGVDDKKIAGETLPCTLIDTPGETPNDLGGDKDLPYQAPSSPHVKISAKTGVDLQELLEVVDERLKYHDEKLNTQSIVDTGFFDRKWRPPRPEDRDAAVER